MKKLCSLVITIRILGVILSDFYLLEISNHCHINKKVLSSKTSLSVKNQTLNKALLQRFIDPPKIFIRPFLCNHILHSEFAVQKLKVLWNFTYITMTLFSITLKRQHLHYMNTISVKLAAYCFKLGILPKTLFIF